MKNETSNLIVTLDTLAMPHLLWGRSIEEYVAELGNFPDMPTDTEIESFFVTGFYYTSEREPHVTVDRSLQYSKLAFDVLSPKGYKMINAFDVTAAFAYDTDGQVSTLYGTMSLPNCDNNKNCAHYFQNVTQTYSRLMACILLARQSEPSSQSSSIICAMMC